MKLKNIILILFTYILIIVLAGCQTNQKSIPIDKVEERIYVTFDDNTEKNYIEDIYNFNIDALKEVYMKYAGYNILEENFIKEIFQVDGDYTIIYFNPVVSGIKLNNSYVIQINNNYITSIATNPSKFKIPEKFDLDKIISDKDKKKLKDKLIKLHKKKGTIDEISDDLYFDCHDYGKLVYTIKISVDTNDYSYAKIYIYDAYTGKLLNEE